MKKIIYSVIETITILIAIISLYLLMGRGNDYIAIGGMLISALTNSLMLVVDTEGEEVQTNEA